LDISHIYSHNHMVGMDKISSSDTWKVYIKMNNKQIIYSYFIGKIHILNFEYFMCW
jgi:hypothetical protein